MKTIVWSGLVGLLILCAGCGQSDDSPAANDVNNGPPACQCDTDQICDDEGQCVDQEVTCEPACGSEQECVDGQCVELSPDDCTAAPEQCGPGTYCDEDSGQCASGCADDVDCAEVFGDGALCDVVERACFCGPELEPCEQQAMGCAVDPEQCGEGTYCDEDSGRCLIGCADDQVCAQEFGEGAQCDVLERVCFCGAGFEVCDNACVPEGQCPEACDCPEVEGGQFECVDGQCVLGCDPSHRLCDGACAPCPSGLGVTQTSCDGASCVATECEAGFEACQGACALCPEGVDPQFVGCQQDACVLTGCPQGEALCDGVCAQCPQDPNAQSTTCNQAGSCVVESCQSSHRLCDGACAPCPQGVPADETRCEAGACVVNDCPEGQHRCDGICVADQSIDHCGGLCEPCAAPQDGQALCNEQLQCDVQCDEGFRFCGQQCALCPVDPNATGQVCDEQDRCVAAACLPGFQVCEDGRCCTWPASNSVIDFLDNVIVDRFSAIVIDRQNFPHVVYNDHNDSGVTYARWDGQDWVSETIGRRGRTGEHFDLVLDAQGRPHVSYHDREDADLYYAHHDGQQWNVQSVDSIGQLGDFTSIALDQDQRPHIVYTDLTFLDLKYAAFDGQRWSIEHIARDGDVGRFAQLQLNAQQVPQVVYLDDSRETLVWARRVQGAWVLEDIEPTVGVASTASTGIGMALDAQGRMHIAYTNTERELLYLQPTGPQSWQEQLVNDGFSVSFVRLVLDAQGTPHIAYKEVGRDCQGRLHYATRAGQQWSSVELGAGGFGLDIAVDDLGQRHISHASTCPYSMRYEIF